MMAVSPRKLQIPVPPLPNARPIKPMHTRTIVKVRLPVNGRSNPRRHSMIVMMMLDELPLLDDTRGRYI